MPDFSLKMHQIQFSVVLRLDPMGEFTAALPRPPLGKSEGEWEREGEGKGVEGGEEGEGGRG